jgi:hypothetical protein
MNDMMSTCMSSMMAGGKMGMMEYGMEHMFLLDRAEQLGTSTQQVNKAQDHSRGMP